MQRALEDMYRKRKIKAIDHLHALEAVFMHRPYQRMPETGWGMAYLFALAEGGPGELEELSRYCNAAEIPMDEFIAEVRPAPDLASFAVRERIATEIFPRGLKILRAFRQTDAFQSICPKKDFARDQWDA